ncbi:MAG: thiamine phosphate synthase [Burkholderiales bacterium]
MRGLYAITPEGAAGERLVALAAAALAGGAVVLQYRSKSSDHAQALHDARALRSVCRDHGALFIVNDDPRLALESEADGVHLGRDDAGLAAARALLGRRIIGVSCYDSLALARAAAAAGADYVAFGSVFASSTKPAAVRAPLELFVQARHLRVPLVAIGGVTLDNAAQAIGAGADCVAVISDLFSASDVKARARAYADLFNRRKVPA